jgi:hypothetical protein
MRIDFKEASMTTAFSTFGSPVGSSQPSGTMPYGTQGFGISPWQQQMPHQSLQFVPQQLQQVQYLQLQQQQVLQQLQQLLQIIPQQIQQLQHIVQFVPQQLQQLQQQLQGQPSPFGQAGAGIGAGFSNPFLSTPLFGAQSFPS